MFALLLLLFNCVATAAPAFAIADHENLLPYSLVSQNLQLTDFAEEAPGSTAFVISRITNLPKQLRPVRNSLPHALSGNRVQDDFAIARNSVTERPGYYAHVFLYSLF